MGSLAAVDLLDKLHFLLVCLYTLVKAGGGIYVFSTACGNFSIDTQGKVTFPWCLSAGPFRLVSL